MRMRFDKVKKLLKKDLNWHFEMVSVSTYVDDFFGRAKYFISIYQSHNDMDQVCFNIHVDQIRPNKPYAFWASYSAGEEYELIKSIYERETGQEIIW